jgi:hypothetical protein
MRTLSFDNDNFMISATCEDEESFWYVNIFCKNDFRYIRQLWKASELAVRMMPIMLDVVKKIEDIERLGWY